MRDAGSRLVGTQTHEVHRLGAQSDLGHTSGDGLELVDVLQNGAEIGGETFEFGMGEFQLRELRDMPDLFQG